MILIGSNALPVITHHSLSSNFLFNLFLFFNQPLIPLSSSQLLPLKFKSKCSISISWIVSSLILLLLLYLFILVTLLLLLLPLPLFLLLECTSLPPPPVLVILFLELLEDAGGDFSIEDVLDDEVLPREELLEQVGEHCRVLLWEHITQVLHSRILGGYMAITYSGLTSGA